MLYQKQPPGSNPLFLPMSAEAEAAARADTNSMFANDSGFEILLPTAEADAIKAQWAAEPMPVPSKVYRAADFLARVTDAEYQAVLQLAAANIQVERWVDLLRVTGHIDVLDATAQAAKVGLVQLGALTQARADALFS